MKREDEQQALVRRIRRRAWHYGLRLLSVTGNAGPDDRAWFVVGKDGEILSSPSGVTLAEADALIPRQRALRRDARVR